MASRPLFRLLCILMAATPALAQGPVMVDNAEIYCTDAARPGYASFGVSYQRSLPNHFGNGLDFCYLQMTALAGPSGGATAGWSHDPATGYTSLGCRAKADATSGVDATVRARFELYAIPAGTADPRCSPAREGRMP